MNYFFEKFWLGREVFEEEGDGWNWVVNLFWWDGVEEDEVGVGFGWVFGGEVGDGVGRGEDDIGGIEEGEFLVDFDGVDRGCDIGFGIGGVRGVVVVVIEMGEESVDDVGFFDIGVVDDIN